MGLACLLAVSAWAAPFTEWTGMTVYAADTVSGRCGENLTWKLENGTLTISGTGDMNTTSYSLPSWDPYYQSITAVSIENGVTSIGDYAFFGYRGLSSITIPDSVTRIGDRAFMGCRGLSSITIPNSVTSIGDVAFYDCRGLSNITISNSVTRIGDRAFADCSSLNSVTYLGTEKEWEKIRSSFPTGINPTFHHIEHTWSDGKCTDCNYECKHTNSDGQSMLVKTEKKTPTCTESGNIAYWTCSECGLKFADEAGANKLKAGGEVLQASGHSYPKNPTQEDWQKNKESHWLECVLGSDCSNLTSSEKSKSEHTYIGDTCSVCGYERTHVHDLTPVAAQDATCTTDGNLAYYKCSGCDSLFEDKTALKATSASEVRIPANGHHYPATPAQADWQKDETSHWLICDLGKECSDLAGSIKEQAAHTYQGDVCSVCGYQKPEDTTKPDDTKTNTNTVTRSDSRDHDDDKGSSTSGSWAMNEKGWYFKRNNGSYPKECWMKLGWLGAESWYYFDSDGYMKTGWLDRNGERYYLNPIVGTNSGKMLTGWQLIDGKWYYFSTEAGAGEGRLLRNTTTPDHYQVDQDGVWQP